MDEETASSDETSKPISRRKLVVWISSTVVAALLIASIAGLLVWRQLNTDKALPDDVAAAQKYTSFPLYYPKGYQYKTGSLDQNAGVVVFTVLLATSNQSVAITEQAKPQNFDFGSLSGTDEFRTPLGQAYVVDFENRTTGSLVTDKTWIIVNASEPIGGDQMRQLLNALVVT